MKCANCGSEFELKRATGPKPKRGRVCSERCRLAVYYSEKRRSADNQLRCADCGCGFPDPHKRGRKPVRCIECAAKARACGCGRRKSSKSPQCWVCYKDSRAPLEYECEQCGGSFTSKRRGGYTPKYCSLACGNRARKGESRPSQWIGDAPQTRYPRSAVYFKTCDCGSPFVGRRHSARYCSEECASKHRPRAITCKTKVCKVCGTEFSTPWAKWVCSDICRKKLQKRSRRRSNKKRRANGLERDRGKHRKRAKRFGVDYEPVRARRVFARDGWRCGICGKKIDRRVKVPHPQSATLDHIIPMSKGGPHLYSNVQAAHFICNSMKGDRSAGEQLLLVG